MLDLTKIADGLEESAPGFWVAALDEPISYPEGGHQRCFSVEDESFWFAHRSECVVSAVRQYPPGGLVFDVGGGNGHVSRALTEGGFPCAVVEPGRAGADAAYDRGIRPVIRATVGAAGFRKGTLPAVGLFDVLEHVEDQDGFLIDLRAMMERSARLYLTVPAFSWLWSVDDERAGHYRRYTVSRLSSVVERAGFEVEYWSYLFRPLPLPILALRSVPSRVRLRTLETDATNDHRAPGGLAGRFVEWMLHRERAAVAGGRSVHFGSSILLVARSRG